MKFSTATVVDEWLRKGFQYGEDMGGDPYYTDANGVKVAVLPPTSC